MFPGHEYCWNKIQNLLCGSCYQAFGLTDTIAKVVHQKGNIFQPRAQRWYPDRKHSVPRLFPYSDGSVRGEGQRRRMLRLIQADFTSAGKTDLCDRTPSGFLHVRHTDTLLSECHDLGLQVVTHEIEFVPLTLVGRVNGHFCRREREDQPPVASVYRGKSKGVPAEGTISRRILAIENDMRTKDH